jgi:predicted amidohydrolase YtcJ
MRSTIPLLLLLTAMPSLAQTPEPVTLAIVNARVWTGDERRPWADAVAIAGERIAAVGSSAEIRKLAPPGARVIDANGGMVVPGFIDSHVHFITGGHRLASVQLRDARTPAEFIARIKAFAATLPDGSWITGRQQGRMGRWPPRRISRAGPLGRPPIPRFRGCWCANSS